VADNVVDKPEHILRSGPALTGGNGATVTVTVLVLLQPPDTDPVTVYVVVVAGLATGLAQLVHDRPVDGLHENVVAPVALSVTVLPGQSVWAGPALTGGSVTTLTVTVLVLIHPLAPVPVTVYVVFVVGVAVGLAQLVQDNVAPGVQL